MSNLDRYAALLAALHDGPRTQPELLAQLGAAYPLDPESRRVMLSRDVRDLATVLGIVIEKSSRNPRIYTLRGGTPHFSDQHLRTLGLFRDSFGPHHPQKQQVQALLAFLTHRLDDQQRAIYQQSQVSSAPLNPAIDYQPFAAIITRLEAAIHQREIFSFTYRNSRGGQLQHTVEPYAVEYYERHFYLVGYSDKGRQILDFRVDRISDLRSVRTLPPHLSQTRERTTVRFRYRLAAELAKGEISQRFEEQEIVERRANGDAIIAAVGRNNFFIIQTMLRYKGKAEILEPEELREEMRAAVRELAVLYMV